MCQWAWRYISIITQPGARRPESIWRICMCSPRNAGRGMGCCCFGIWRVRWWGLEGRGWSGVCWSGMSRVLNFIKRWERGRWWSGRRWCLMGRGWRGWLGSISSEYHEKEMYACIDWGGFHDIFSVIMIIWFGELVWVILSANFWSSN